MLAESSVGKAGSCALGVLARQRCALPPPPRRRWHAQRRVARHAAAPPSAAARTPPRSRLSRLPHRRFPPSPSRVRTNKPNEWPDGSLAVGNGGACQSNSSTLCRRCSPARSAKMSFPRMIVLSTHHQAVAAGRRPGRTYYCRPRLFLMNKMFLMDRRRWAKHTSS